MDNNKLSTETIKSMIDRSYKIIDAINNLLPLIIIPVVDVNDKSQNELKAQLVMFTDELAIIDSKLNESEEDTEEIAKFKDAYKTEKSKLELVLNTIKTKEVLKIVKEMKESLKAKIAADEVNNILNEIENEYGIDASEVKVVPVNYKKKPFALSLIGFIIGFVINFITMFALSSLISFGSWNSITDLFIFIAYVSGIELVLKWIVDRFFVKYIIKTFGFILIIPLVASIAIGAIWPLVIHIDSYILMIVVCVLSYIIRKFITVYISEKVIMKGKKHGTKGNN